MIPNKTVEEIMSTARVEEVIEDFVNLKRKGTNFTGLCPFHDEKTPSFVVSPAKGIFKCFGCGKTGNAVGFIMEHENLSYPESLRYLANRYNIQIEEVEVSDEEKQARQLSDSLYIINDFASKHFTENVLETNEGKSVGLSYFKERGFNNATIKEWQLGYAMGEGSYFTKRALEKQFNIEYLKMLGLTTNTYETDFFKNRVMFAIHNLGGKIIAFAGRVLGNKKDQPKYINSPESEIYLKRKVLFGMYFAKNEIRKVDECYMVEGYTDVITLYQGGVKNAVASSGTSLTVEQVSLVKRFTDNLTIIYDGDKAGIKAALRGLDIALQQNVNVRLVLLPDGDDPDSFFKKSGVEEFTNFIKQNRKDFIRFKADLLIEESGNDPIKRAEVLRDIVSSVAIIPDAIKRSIYIQQLSHQLEVEEKILVSEVDKAVNKHKQEYRKDKERDLLRERRLQEQSDVVIDHDKDEILIIPSTTSADINIELNLVRLLVLSASEVYDESTSQVVADILIPLVAEFFDLVDDSRCKTIFEYAISKYEAKQSIESIDFINNSNGTIRSLAVEVSMFPYSYAKWEEKGVYLQNQPVPEKNIKNDLDRTMLRFKLVKISKEIDLLEKEIKSNTDTNRDLNIELQVLLKLIAERNNISKKMTQIVI